MPCSRVGRSTSTTPWSKSMSITRSATMHSRPIETCWKAEIVHSWPRTDLAPMRTSPSCARIFVPWPIHDQRPRCTTASLPISRVTPGQTNAIPSVFSRPRKRSFSQARRASSGALPKLRRAADRQVAVLSIDPSSPFTQGALLGDRIRLTEHFLDPGVFIRSMANRGALGGLSEAALQAALLMDAAGKDDVFLETVGVGQAEVDIIDHADTIVLVLMPGSGDSIQALKAGVMEIPDIIVVNKADHPLTDTMVREIRGVLSLKPTVEGGWRVPIVKTEAVRGEGVAQLVEKLDEHRARIDAEGTLSE